MALIEGVGDEVTVIVALVTILAVFAITWLSTHVTDRSLIHVVVYDNTTSGNESNTAQSPISDPANASPDDVTQTGDDVTQTTEPSTPEANEDIGSPSDGQRDEEVTSHRVAEQTGDLSAIVSESSPDEMTCDEMRASRTCCPDEMRASRIKFFTKTVQSNEPSTPNTSCELIDKQLVVGSQRDRATDNTSTTLLGTNTAPTDCATDSTMIEGTTDNTTTECATDSTTTESATNSTTITGATDSTPAEGATNSTTIEGATAEIPEGYIRVRLKYLTDIERLVQTKREETIENFRREHFAEELSENKTVRLFFRGHELNADAHTLERYDVMDNSVIHCLIRNIPREATRAPDSTSDDLDLGRFMLPLFGFMLAVFWYLRIQYRTFFNTVSTMALLFISFLFLVATLANVTRQRQGQAPDGGSIQVTYRQGSPQPDIDNRQHQE